MYFSALASFSIASDGFKALFKSSLLLLCAVFIVVAYKHREQILQDDVITYQTIIYIKPLKDYVLHSTKCLLTVVWIN